MGLDMYILSLPEGMDARSRSRRWDSATEEVYWRKANAIHGWFVHNVQNDVDQCQWARIRKSDIKKLIDACNYVLNGGEGWEDVLPPTQGFFFGSYGYDSDYVDDIEFTQKKLTELLERWNPRKYYYYHSSW